MKKKRYLTNILHYFRENGYYEAPAQGQDGPAVEVSTAGGFRGRQASRVAIAAGLEESITSVKEGHATVKEGFATYEESFATCEESFATDEESFATAQEKVMGDTLKFRK